MKQKPLTKLEIRRIAANRGYEARYSGKTQTWFFHKDGKQISGSMGRVNAVIQMLSK